MIAMSSLVPIDARSFHEIASAAEGYRGGASYDPSTPYTPTSTGLPAEVLERIARELGLDLEELNRRAPPPAPEAVQASR
jgi:hypothetical protein